jgi:hypothetical protein
MPYETRSAGSGGFFNFGNYDWANTSNITASNNTFATCTLVALNGESKYLYGSNFGFSIPSDATINGLSFEIEWKQSGSGGTTASGSVFAAYDVTDLYGSGYAGYAAISTSAIPTSDDVYRSAGGSSELWNTTWTASQVNASTFGCWIAAKNGFATANNVISADHIRATVWWTEAVSGQPARKRMGGVAFAHGGYQPGTGIRRWRHSQNGLILPNRSIIQPESRLAS